MSEIKILKLDLLGTNSDNVITGERQALDDTNLEYIRPTHTPFYSSTLVITDVNGQILKEGEDKDYVLVNLIFDLVNRTGKSVHAFIRIVNRDLYQRAPLSMKYHSIGINHITPDMVKQTLGGTHGTDIDFEKDIMGRPETFPASAHVHDITTDITNWDELINVLNAMWNFRKKRSRQMYDELKKYVDTTWVDVRAEISAIELKIDAHARNYENPHEVDAWDVDLGNVENTPTGSLFEQLAGTPNTLVTAAGAQAIVDNTNVINNDILKAGKLPFSYFGTDFWIPPLIVGDFRGLGSKSETMALSLEDNGKVVGLANVFDGRVDMLAFHIAGDSNDVTNTDYPYYTGYQYTHPTLDAAGVVPNDLVASNGSEVLMIGVRNTNTWYVAATNGTLNPEAHVLAKADISAVTTLWNGSLNAAGAGSVYSPANYSVCTIMGNWVYLILSLSFSGDAGTSTRNARQYFFRVPLADVKAGNPVKFVQTKVARYVDFNGRVTTNSDFYTICIPTKDSNGAYTQIGHLFSPALTTTWGAYRRFQIMTAQDLDNPTRWIGKFVAFIYGIYGTTSSAAWTLEATYSIDPDTLTFEKTPQQMPVLTIDPRRFQESAYMQPFEVEHWRIGKYLTASFDRSSAALFSNGVMCISQTSGENRFPPQLPMAFMKHDVAPHEILSVPFSNSNFPNLWDHFSGRPETIAKYNSPTLHGVNLMGVGFHPGGEFITEKEATKYGIYYREVTGEFQTREGVNIIGFDSVKCRPLTQKIRKTSLAMWQSMVTFSGGASTLNSLGLEMGYSAFPMGWRKSLAPRTSNRGWEDPIDDGVMLTTATKRSINLDDGLYDYTPTEVVYYPEELIKTMVVAMSNVATYNSNDWEITITDLASGELFTKFGINAAFAHLSYRPVGTTTRVNVFRPFKPTYGAMTGIVKPVTGITWNGTASSRTLTTTENSQTPWLRSGPITTIRNGQFQAYLVDGSTDVQVSWYIGQLSHVATGRTGNEVNFTFNRNTGVVDTTKTVMGAGSWAYVDNDLVLVPKVGLCTSVNSQSLASGTAALLAYEPGSTTKAIMLASVYPDSAWSIYFIYEENVTFNGKDYRVPNGSINLFDIDPAPQNKTFYLYVGLLDTGAEYVITPVKYNQSGSMLYLGAITTGLKQITKIEVTQPFTVAGKTLSIGRRGQAIPVSTGQLTGTGELDWG